MSNSRNNSSRFFGGNIAKILLNNKNKKRRHYTEKNRQKRRATQAQALESMRRENINNQWNLYLDEMVDAEPKQQAGELISIKNSLDQLISHTSTDIELYEKINQKLDVIYESEGKSAWQTYFDSSMNDELEGQRFQTLRRVVFFLSKVKNADEESLSILRQARSIIHQMRFDEAKTMWIDYKATSGTCEDDNQRYDKVGEIFNLLEGIKFKNEGMDSFISMVSGELERLQYHLEIESTTDEIDACQESLIDLIKHSSQSIEAIDALLLEIAELNESMVPIYERLNRYHDSLNASLTAKTYLYKLSVFGEREKEFSDELDESIQKNRDRLGYQVLGAS